MSLLHDIVQGMFYRCGYQLVRTPVWPRTRKVHEHRGYRLLNWKKDDGQIDVAGYRREQERGNRAKIGQVWTSETSLLFISRWLSDRGLEPRFVICHGTRNGFEQRVFSNFFQCEVIGTEISATASQFPMTVQADFHEARSEWSQKADLVYSNSLDHAYDPAKALRAWAEAVRDRGVIVLEKASDSDPRGVSDLDPFGITLANLVVLLLETLGDIACVRGVLDVPQPRDGAIYHKMIVVEINRDPLWLQRNATASSSA